MKKSILNSTYGASGSPPNLFDNIQKQKEGRPAMKTLKIPRKATLQNDLFFFFNITLTLVRNY